LDNPLVVVVEFRGPPSSDFKAFLTLSVFSDEGSSGFDSSLNTFKDSDFMSVRQVSEEALSARQVLNLTKTVSIVFRAKFKKIIGINKVKRRTTL